MVSRKPHKVRKAKPEKPDDGVRRDGTRMPKRPAGVTVRAHVQMPPEWRRAIDDTAIEMNMSRSSFIAKAAYLCARNGAFPVETGK